MTERTERTQELRGSTALVTGASSGLGADFARELGARGADLVLVARRRELLDALAEELRASGARADVVATDLTDAAAREALHAELTRAGRAIDVLVNNAGFGLFGRFVDLPWEREREMLELDVVSLVHLTKLFVRPMVERRFGRVLQVSSIGAYQPSPTYAVYSAAKAFVLSFGEALHDELRGTGVTCTVVSPGVTATEFLRVAGQQPTAYQRRMMMTSGEVARAGVTAMLQGRATIVPGFLNAFGAFAMSRLLPRRAATRLAGRLME
jgi:short-subunit dehydrogenase